LGDWGTGEWRKIHNEELNDRYFSINTIRGNKLRIRWAGHVACTGARRGLCRVWLGKPEGKRPLGRPRCRYEDNLRWIFRKCDVEYGLD